MSLSGSSQLLQRILRPIEHPFCILASGNESPSLLQPELGFGQI
jgi:hypothetical protein